MKKIIEIYLEIIGKLRVIIKKNNKEEVIVLKKYGFLLKMDDIN